MSKLRKLYKRIRYWRQIKQGFGLLEEYGTKVELTRVTDLAYTDWQGKVYPLKSAPKPPNINQREDSV